MNKIFLYLVVLLIFSFGCYADEMWLKSEYLLWTCKKAPLAVPLVTSASLNDPLPGALGQPGTKVLLGDKGVDLNWRNGFRLMAGKGRIEGSFFMLPNKGKRQSVQTSGEPGSRNLAVPIYDVTGLWGLNGVPGETIFILPGPIDGPGFRGRFSLKMSNQLMGFDLNCSENVCSGVDFIGGLRWLQLQESFSFSGKTAAIPGAFVSGFYNFKDHFQTSNNFYGVQIGLKGNYCFNRWNLNGFAKLALGCMDQQAKIKGKSQTSNGNLFYRANPSTMSGGIFAEPTNRGSHHRNAFAIALETGINLSYQLSNCLEVGVGYNFLWLDQVLRPGEQIDRKINSTRTALADASRRTVGIGPDQPVPFGESAAAPLPRGPHRPKSKYHSTDFWAQGLVVNLTFNF